MPTAKDEVRDLLNQLPDDSSFDDIQYHIYIRQKVRRALDDEAHGRVVSQTEMETRMSRWLDK